MLKSISDASLLYMVGRESADLGSEPVALSSPTKIRYNISYGLGLVAKSPYLT